MQTRSLRISMMTLVLGASLSAATASAQINPEGGDVWVPPPDDTGSASPNTTTTPSQQPQQQPWYQGGPTGTTETPERPPAVDTRTTEPTSTSSSSAPEQDDHQRVVGRLAVGFMGATNVPIGGVGTGAFAVETVTAPALGVRYWVADLVGIDVGLGLGFLGGNTQSGRDSAPADNAFAMLIHGGVPLALYHQDHYKFLIIPEVNIGFATGTAYGFTPQDDRGRNGFLFQIGGRVGTEIHFGFMGVPQLSLQASVGLYFQYTSAGLGGNSSGADPVGVNTYALGTTVMGEPWDIFLGSLSALYYF